MLPIVKASFSFAISGIGHLLIGLIKNWMLDILCSWRWQELPFINFSVELWSTNWDLIGWIDLKKLIVDFFFDCEFQSCFYIIERLISVSVC